MLDVTCPMTMLEGRCPALRVEFNAPAALTALHALGRLASGDRIYDPSAAAAAYMLGRFRLSASGWCEIDGIGDAALSDEEEDAVREALIDMMIDLPQTADEVLRWDLDALAYRSYRPAAQALIRGLRLLADGAPDSGFQEPAADLLRQMEESLDLDIIGEAAQALKTRPEETMVEHDLRHVASRFRHSGERGVLLYDPDRDLVRWSAHQRDTELVGATELEVIHEQLSTVIGVRSVEIEVRPDSASALDYDRHPRWLRVHHDAAVIAASPSC